MNSTRAQWLGLGGLTAAAFFIHGYHPFSEDAETYLPGIEKIVKPNLFPIGNEYFQLHAHRTLFPQLLAWPIQSLHIPLPWVLLFWQVACFFLFLLACFTLMRRLFPSATAAWAGVCLVTALFTMPVAGTALYLIDPFLNPRNVIAFAEVFAIVCAIDRRYWAAFLLLGFSGAVHPLMTAYAVSFMILLVVVDRWPSHFPLMRPIQKVPELERAGYAAPALILFDPVEGLFSSPSDAYDRVSEIHRYQFLTRWTWYEMLGAVAPPLIFIAFALIARKRRLRTLELLSWTTAIFGFIYLAIGFGISLPHRLETFSLLQPMRSLHMVYILMILIGGGLLGEYVLKNRTWRWVALFAPLSVGMCWAQRALYPGSQHIEWPASAPRNQWVQAFNWIRENTPEDAIFAIDPYYMKIHGEDTNGFRAITQRSRLADVGKDSGVAELFPNIATDWSEQVKAQTGIDHFGLKDFEHLRAKYGATWVVLLRASRTDLACPYSNDAVMVCRIP